MAPVALTCSLTGKESRPSGSSTGTRRRRIADVARWAAPIPPDSWIPTGVVNVISEAVMSAYEQAFGSNEVIASNETQPDELKPEDGDTFQVTCPGGAILRRGPDLNDGIVGVAENGTLVVALEERGRRTYVQAASGVRGWISLYTIDGVPIARRAKRMQRPSAGGRPSRADRERKWRLLNVDADGVEGTIPSLRRGSAGVPSVPIKHWRPPRVASSSSALRMRPPSRRELDEEVPRLSAPPVAASGVGLHTASDTTQSLPTSLLNDSDSGFGEPESEPAPPPVAVGEDLLDLSTISTSQGDEMDSVLHISPLGRVPALVDLLRDGLDSGAFSLSARGPRRGKVSDAESLFYTTDAVFTTSSAPSCNVPSRPPRRYRDGAAAGPPQERGLTVPDTFEFVAALTDLEQSQPSVTSEVQQQDTGEVEPPQATREVDPPQVAQALESPPPLAVSDVSSGQTSAPRDSTCQDSLH